jgi:hypothetical protein
MDGLTGQAVLDAIPAVAVLLEASGRIVAVNRAWVQFCLSNGGELAAVSPPVDYLAACAAAAPTSTAREVIDGITAVVTGAAAPGTRRNTMSRTNPPPTAVIVPSSTAGNQPSPTASVFCAPAAQQPNASASISGHTRAQGARPSTWTRNAIAAPASGSPRQRSGAWVRPRRSSWTTVAYPGSSPNGCPQRTRSPWSPAVANCHVSRRTSELRTSSSRAGGCVPPRWVASITGPSPRRPDWPGPLDHRSQDSFGPGVWLVGVMFIVRILYVALTTLHRARKGADLSAQLGRTVTLSNFPSLGAVL